MLDTLVLPAPETPVWNTSHWVESIEQHLGGNGANTAYTIARLGVASRLAGCIGRDPAGERLLAILGTAGVDTSFVERVDGPTASSVALVRADGARALMHCPGASLAAFRAPPPLDRGLSRGCGFLHVGNPFGVPGLRTNASAILRDGRALGLRTSLDAGWDSRGEWMAVLGPCLAETGTLFVNQLEAHRLSGHGEPSRAAAALRDAGAGCVVIKLGAEGCLVLTADREFRSPGLRVPVRDTTGAGDCFSGGFVTALARGFDLERAARFANAVGALSVTALGSVAALLSFDDTVAWMGAQPA